MNFRELKAQLDAIEAERNGTTLSKSHGAAGDFGQARDYDMDAAMRDLKRTRIPSTKGAHAALRKSLGTLAKAMSTASVLGATHMEAPVAKPKRQYTAAEIEAACHKALAAGAITAAEANHIASHLAVSGRCPDEYMAKLEGHAPKARARLSKAQALEAAGDAIRAGALSSHEAQVLEAIIQSDNPVPPAIMKALSKAYAGLRYSANRA